MKKIFIIISIVSLIGCAPRALKPNPFVAYSSQQLKGISDAKLCKVINSPKYQVNTNLQAEMIRRGMQHCSRAEVICRKKAANKGGSYSCRGL